MSYHSDCGGNTPQSSARIKKTNGPKPVVFLKPHRVGSTYWRRALEQAYAPSCFVPTKEITGPDFANIPPNISVELQDRLLSDKQQQLPSEKFMCSARHIGWNDRFFSRIMRPDYQYVTLIRDPLKRSVSHFDAFIRKNSKYDNWSEWYLNGNDSENQSIPIDNYYNWFLGFNLTRPDADLSHMSEFAVIGITEKWMESTLLLAQTLNINWRAIRPSRAMASGGTNGNIPKNQANKQKLNVEAVKKFKTNNAIDYHIYNSAYENMARKRVSTLQLMAFKANYAIYVSEFQLKRHKFW